MFGCLVALLQGTPRFERVYAIAMRLPWLAATALAICSVLGARFQNYFNLTIGYTIESVLFGLLLLWCTRNAETLVGRVLNWRPIVWIGALSYSIYLWQTLFLHLSDTTVFGMHNSPALIPVRWGAILLAACLSFYLVEQPLLRLRNRILRGTGRTA
jgi:peptidoglycan/LPS O-acetylase OafA/YrhL